MAHSLATATRLGLAMSIIAASGGCASIIGQPRSRVGSLPFPGMLTLYQTADPERLGRHHYGPFPASIDNQWEADRGIVYTRRAGFLDLAHVRMAADWCRYIHRSIHPALLDNAESVSFEDNSFTRYTVRIEYPSAWHALTPMERARAADEFAVPLAQQLAYDKATWHEIITWFGYKSTVVIPEDASAFTYDDTTSHLVGIHIAGLALRDPQMDYDQAVTAAMDAAMRRLEAVAPAETEAAIEAVEGVWWRDNKPLRRHVDHGYDDGVVMPWLVAGFESARGELPLRLPPLRVESIDFRSSIRVRVHTRILERNRIYAALELDGGPIIAWEHFPQLIEHIGRSENHTAGR